MTAVFHWRGTTLVLSDWWNRRARGAAKTGAPSRRNHAGIWSNTSRCRLQYVQHPKCSADRQVPPILLWVRGSRRPSRWPRNDRWIWCRDPMHTSIVAWDDTKCIPLFGRRRCWAEPVVRCVSSGQCWCDSLVGSEQPTTKRMLRRFSCTSELRN